MKKVFIWLIRLYQRRVSPHLGSHCRFTPTCSEYAAQAVEERGAFIGLFLSLYRILRCNPFCKGGYDPVPGKKKRNPRR